MSINHTLLHSYFSFLFLINFPIWQRISEQKSTINLILFFYVFNYLIISMCVCIVNIQISRFSLRFLNFFFCLSIFFQLAQRQFLSSIQLNSLLNYGILVLDAVTDTINKTHFPFYFLFVSSFYVWVNYL